ncbi:MAG: DoxX family protein [Afipia sp.]|nr:DoxX family protein [Afipia sp.]
MPPLVTLGRILFAVLFVYAGADKLLDIAATSQMVAGKVMPALPAALAPYTSQIEATAGMPADRVLAILAGVLEVLGGLAIALNIGARLLSILLVIFVAIVTYCFHDFWNMTGADRTTNLYSALKNLSLIGGLLIVAGYPRPVIEDTNYTGAAETKF